jgi:hypothetical protein
MYAPLEATVCSLNVIESMIDSEIVTAKTRYAMGMNRYFIRRGPVISRVSPKTVSTMAKP